MSAGFDSPYYPYSRIQPGYLSFRGTEEIPHKLLVYLLDMPDAAGYTPVDDNTRPRVRLMKYLWYDGADPLAQPLPSPQEKLSLLFDGNEPVLNTDELKSLHPKGYRLYWQRFWGEAQTQAQTTVKCYMGREFAQTPFSARLGVTFEITCNVNQETTTRTDAYSRAYAIEQCIKEALHGVNITGIGVVDISRLAHADNGSRSIYDQTGTLVGRELKMSIHWEESESGDERVIQSFENF